MDLGEWVTDNVQIVLNDSLEVQDTLVPIELLLRPGMVLGFANQFSTTEYYNKSWKPEFKKSYTHVAVVQRPVFAPPPLVTELSAAEGYAVAMHAGGPVYSAVSRMRMGEWPPFRSLDAGLASVQVKHFERAADEAPETLFLWTYRNDEHGERHTAEPIKHMIQALSGFMNPVYGEPIRFVSEAAQVQSITEDREPLIVQLHPGTYRRLVQAGDGDGDGDGNASASALDLATSLSAKTLWYLAVIALTTANFKTERQQKFYNQLQKAALAILEAIPGPCFPVRLRHQDVRRAEHSVWELRPCKRVHGEWFVEIPLHMHEGAGAAKEPVLLPYDFSLKTEERAGTSTYGASSCSRDVFLPMGILRWPKGSPLSSDKSIESKDWAAASFLARNRAVRDQLVRRFIWTSAGLFCVAPAALMFSYFRYIATNSSLLPRLQLLWNGTEDVDSNAVTYNNVMLLLSNEAYEHALPEMPPMGQVEASWTPGWREVLHLPSSKMGVREAPASILEYPAIVQFSTTNCCALARLYGVPLDDYRRMNVDAAILDAPPDVQLAMLQVRAALLDGDTSIPYLAEEVLATVKNESDLVTAAFFRCNAMLPIQTATFFAARGPGGERLGGVEYDTPGQSSGPKNEPV
jgi:hypothetical protein